jgi:hypothetical protein
MKWVIALTLIGAAATSGQGVAPPKKLTHYLNPAAPGQKPISRTKAPGVAGSGKSHPVLASTRVAGQKTSRRGRGRYTRGGRVKRRPPVPSYQTSPGPERYQEIQKALAERGYYKGEPNGLWQSDSVDALKAFQADLKLDTDGKINARSLQGLGLGAKHEGSAAGSTPIPPPTTEITPPQ